jgi:hypothetical protein
VERSEGNLAESRRLLEQATADLKVVWQATGSAEEANRLGGPQYRLGEGLRSGGVEQADSAARWLGEAQLQLTHTLLLQGDHAAAARSAADLAATFPDNWHVLHHAAQSTARCVPLAGSDTTLPRARRVALVQNYTKASRDLFVRAEQATAAAPGPVHELAWTLASWPDAVLLHPLRAVSLARHAVSAAPREPAFWDTLGVACYRAGDCESCVLVLAHFRSLKGDNDTRQRFYLAMSYQRLGEPRRARDQYWRAVVWLMTHEPDNAPLQRLRTEAAGLLGLTDLSAPAGSRRVMFP